MNKLILILYCINFFISSSSCKSKPNNIVVDTLIFNDSITSSKLIVLDDRDRYFEYLQPIDVAIQMKDNLLLTNPHYKVIYKNHLKTQVSDFSEDDKEFLTKVYNQTMIYITKINPEFKLKFSVSKIKPGHFGNDVFYTRGNVIFFPENIFIEKNEAKITSIMLHEIWHIMAEQNPVLKEKLYKLIGFQKHDFALNIPPKLNSILLTNPDGGDRSFAMKLKNGKWLIPFLRSNQPKFNLDKPVFFDYIQFDVFYLSSDGKIEINSDNSSTVSPEDNMEFFQNIKDNTQYIIHPDEIIADNFMLTILAENKNDYKNFSKEGQILMKKILTIIKD